MNGGITFRQAIDSNKRRILEYISANGISHTTDICKNYTGEKELPAVRKALNELRKEGKVTTDDKVEMWQGKKWWLTNNESKPSPNA